MKNILRLSVYLLATALIAISCTKDAVINEGEGNNPDNTPKETTFISYLPTEGTDGTEVAITGTNFGESITNVKVWVNDIEIIPIAVTNTRINFKIPEDCGSGVVKVQVGELSYTFNDSFAYVDDPNPVYWVTTLAGEGGNKSVDGTGNSAFMTWPYFMTYDKIDDVLFFIEFGGDGESTPMKLRKVNKEGTVTTVLDLTAQARYPRALAFSLDGDTLFVSNESKHNWADQPMAVGYLTRNDGFSNLQTYITSSQLPKDNITGLAIHPVDGSLFTYHKDRSLYRYNRASDTFEPVITREQFGSVVNGVWPTYNGGQNTITDGQQLNGGVVFSLDGKTIYWNGREPYQGLLSAKYDISTHTSSDLAQFAGNGCWGIADGFGDEARFDQPNQIAIDSKGFLYTADSYGHIIRKISPSGYVTTFAGKGYNANIINGKTDEARFCSPFAIAIDKDDKIYVGEFCNHRIREISR